MRASEERRQDEAPLRGRGAAAEAAIVRAFREILSESGFARLRLEHVARRAGVSKATLYRRWSSKEQLAAHVLLQIGEELSLGGTPTSVDRLLSPAGVGPVIRGLLCEIANDPVVGEAYRTHVLAAQRDAIRESIRTTAAGPAAAADDGERTVDIRLAEIYFQFIFCPVPDRLPPEGASGRTRVAGDGLERGRSG